MLQWARARLARQTAAIQARAVWTAQPTAKTSLAGRVKPVAAASHGGDAASQLRRVLWEGDAVQMQLLLDAGASPQFRHANGMTALHVAAHRGDADMVAVLLARGADPLTRAKDGDTPLHSAMVPSFDGFPDERVRAINALLDAGADAKAANGAKFTPLILAVEYGAPLAVLDVLIRKGASVNAATAGVGMTALLMALINRPSMCERDVVQSTVERLLAAGANPRVIGYNGMTPFAMATMVDRPLEVCRALIKAGVGLHDTSDNVPQPLNLAVHHDNVALVDMLLDLGADVDRVCKMHKVTPLMHACRMGVRGEAAALRLIERGAKINARCEANAIALHYALSSFDVRGEAMTPSLRTVRALLEHGADVLAVSPLTGRDPKDINKDPEIYALVHDYVERKRRKRNK